ncbi:MAG: lysophospholipid acyltransferase family protein [bacterium]|nr:lysophospholipid acyltransferase family protein [bacterium]
MASLSHQIEYMVTLGMAKYAQRLSEEKADRLGIRLGGLMYHVLRSRRAVALDNLRKALGNEYSEEELQEIARKVFANIGQTLVEFSRFKQLGLAGVRRLVTGPGEEMLARAYAEGKGGIMLTAHFGNWEIMGAWVAAVGYPTDFLVGRQHNQKVDKLLLSYRSEMKVGLIPLATAARSVFKTLKANRIAGIVADQHAPGSGSVIIDFFGRPAAWAKGPALFSIRAGAPILPYLLRRERYDKHVLIPGEPIYPPNSGDEEKDIETMLVAYARFVEKWVRKYPDQWMWTHRRWKLDSPAT